MDGYLAKKTKRRTSKANVVFHDIARFRAQLFDRLLRPHGLTMAQAWVLVHLSRDDGLTQSELAKRIEIGTVTLGGLVDRLEARGFVERRVDANDRRANRVHLTDEARPLIRVMSRYSKDIDTVAYRGLPKQTVDELGSVLNTVRDNLLAALQDEKTTGASPGEHTAREKAGAV